MFKKLSQIFEKKNDKSYQCTLLDFTCSTEMFGTAPEDINIHFNMCREQLVGDTRDNLVRHTVVQRGKCQMEKFIHPYYVDVRPMNTNLSEIWIKDRNGKNVSFLTDITTRNLICRKTKLLKSIGITLGHIKKEHKNASVGWMTCTTRCTTKKY